MTQKEANRFFIAHRVRVDLFNSDCHFFFSKEDWQKAMGWRGERHKINGSGGVTCESVLTHNETGEEDSVLMVGIFDPAPDVVAHECIHAANHILDRIGYERKDKYDEILPYLTGYLVKACFSKMEKLKK